MKQSNELPMIFYLSNNKISKTEKNNPPSYSNVNIHIILTVLRVCQATMCPEICILTWTYQLENLPHNSLEY